LGVSVVGSGAVLLALKKSGAISSIRPALVAWQTHGYFLSAALQTQLLAVAGELTY
jgi:predicted nucleic acid-binding protein